jgi:hypothetical protein
MIVRRIPICLSVAFLIFSSTVFAGGYESAYSSRFGIGARGPDVNNYSQDLGSYWARLPVDVNETNYNNVNMLFTAVDNSVRTYQSAGVVPYGNINPRAVSTWITAEQFASAVSQLVERYDGDGVDDMPGLLYPIKVWEMINDYSSSSPASHPERALFIEIFRQGAQAIRNVCVDCLVAYDPFNREDTIALLNTVSANNIDILAYHTYAPLDKPKTAGSELYLLNLTNYLADLGLTGKPVWATEYAFYDNPTMTGSVESGTVTASQTDNARWFVQTTSYALGTGLFEKIVYTEISSPADGMTGSPLDWMSLIDKNGNKRQVYFGFKRMSGLVDRFLSKEQLQLGTDVYGFRFGKAYENIYVIWSKEGTGLHNTTLPGLRGSLMTVKHSVPDTSNNFASDEDFNIDNASVAISSLGSEPLYYVETFPSIFGDVSTGVWYENYAYALYNKGITVGCGQNPLRYCPADEVTRGQMAAFIIRSLYGETFTYTTAPHYTDVPSDHTFFKYVQRLKDDGTTAVTGIYGVDSYVTRGQMAAFIIRAKYGENFAFTPTPHFDDVPSDHIFFKYVQRLKDDGTTAVTGVYGVENVVTREQMAAFLGRGFLGME